MKELQVRLFSHSQLSQEFLDHVAPLGDIGEDEPYTDGEAIALTAIRTCYSPNDPWDILNIEGGKYFNSAATDGMGGKESDRLFRMITSSGHTSTMEHISFTFVITGVSRALLAQLTRHRAGLNFSVQSQRYVKFGTADRSGGFDYIIPKKVADKGEVAVGMYKGMMAEMQSWYDTLRDLGIPSEDARSVLPNAASVNLTMTVNLTALIAFYSKRRAGNGAQQEIAYFAEELRNRVVKAEPWTNQFFDNAWHGKTK